MLKGCLFLLILLAGTYFAEDYYLRIIHPDLEWWVPLLLAFGLAVSISNLWGIWLVLKQKRMSAISPSEWKDGQEIGIGGKLRALRAPLTSPLTNRPVIAYEYSLRHISGSGKNQSSRTIFGGAGMAACSISTPRGAVRLTGFPFMNHFPSTEGKVTAYITTLAEYFARTRFKVEASNVLNAWKQLKEITSDEDGELKIDSTYGEPPFEVLRDDTAADSSSTPSLIKRTHSSFKSSSQSDNEGMDAEYFRSQLTAFNGLATERVVKVEEEVAAFGIFRANPPRIDIGQALSKPNHGLFPGEIGRVLFKKIIASLLFSLVWIGATVAGHYYVYALLPRM